MRDPASFRDPSGFIQHDGGRVLRAVTAAGAASYEHIRSGGHLQRWIDRGWVIPTREVDARIGGEHEREIRYVLEHDRIRFVSYPYEWTFRMLQAAALLHLDLQLDALGRGVALSDASAYNIQFDGARPVFIDVLSFQPYQPGDYWLGHRQFCEQFLNPLLLRALTGVPHNAWFRGSLEGITAAELNAVLPARAKVSWNVFSHVTLPARLAARAAGATTPAAAPRKPLARSAYQGLLTQLRDWIAGLAPKGHAKTTWSDYDTTHTYSEAERTRKREIVAGLVGQARPAMLWDIGCNTGEYSQLALESGAGAVVGFEPDQGACERAFSRARDLTQPFLPLLVDAANASPDQGWDQRERRGLSARGPADALLALAVVHHLAIGRNVPLDDIARWLTSQARTGVVEFVQKSDPTVQLMLTSRKDIFDTYSEEAFAAALARYARIVSRERISAAGRVLYVFERS